MILFPNAKINLGLDVVRRRPDGYHDISTVMMPIDWHDVLEIVPAKNGRTTLTTYGRPIDCPPEKNLVMKAYRALSDMLGGLPPTDIYIEKIIPDGAGLGGGSADAAFTLVGLNEVFNLGLEKRQLAEVAAMIGADCPFFIYNTPAYCSGTGTDISHDIKLELAPYSILIAKPRVASVSTKEAYEGVTPCEPELDIRSILKLPPSQWQGKLKNDFEPSVFRHIPRIEEVKKQMLACGAVYASMSGSGSAVYGIYANAKMAQEAALQLSDCDICVSQGCN